MENKGTLVRTDLSREEYAELRKQAIDAGEKISTYAGAHLRTLIPKRKRSK